MYPGKCTFASYCYTTPGFPGVVLKYYVENGELSAHYITVSGAMREGIISFTYRPSTSERIAAMIESFDSWTRWKFSEDASVQG